MISATLERTDQRILSESQVAFYLEHGYLHIPQVFSPGEMDALDRELMQLIDDWSSDGKGWTGPWRLVYMDKATEKKSKLVALHDLQLYSQAWARAVTNPRLCDAMADLLGPNVELHH